MSPEADVAVVGAGVMGLATARALARGGRDVVVYEQFAVGHDRGSSHGGSRIIRQSYFEDPAYVPLLLRAYELWDRLERDSGRPLLTPTGGLMIGKPASEVVTGSLRSAREHGLAHELLDAPEIRRRFPPLTPSRDHVALYETRAGVLRPEDAIHAHLSCAASAGAEIRSGELVLGWRASDRGVELRTASGRIEAGRVVLAPGPWAPALFDLPLPLEVERQVLYWFDPAGGAAPFAADRFPIYIWDLDGGIQFYGFPADPSPPGGVKVAFFRTGRGARCTADDVDRTVSAEEIAAMRSALAPCIPALASGRLTDTVTCLYTLTPDHHFVIGPHPRHPQVILASPCSGHGYKFASVVGEILADLAIEGQTRHPIALFDPDRFKGG